MCRLTAEGAARPSFAYYLVDCFRCAINRQVVALTFSMNLAVKLVEYPGFVLGGVSDAHEQILKARAALVFEPKS